MTDGTGEAKILTQIEPWAGSPEFDR